MFPTLLEGSHLKQHSLSKWIKSIFNLQFRISTICNKSVHFLHFLRNELKPSHELIMSHLFEFVKFILSSLDKGFTFFEDTFFVFTVGFLLFEFMDDLNVWVGCFKDGTNGLSF